MAKYQKSDIEFIILLISESQDLFFNEIQPCGFKNVKECCWRDIGKKVRELSKL